MKAAIELMQYGDESNRLTPAGQHIFGVRFTIGKDRFDIRQADDGLLQIRKTSEAMLDRITVFAVASNIVEIG